MSYPYRSVAWALVVRHVLAVGIRDLAIVLRFDAALLSVGDHRCVARGAPRSKHEGREAAGHEHGCRVDRREDSHGAHGMRSVPGVCVLGGRSTSDF